jgi:phage terminase small subunit
MIMAELTDKQKRFCEEYIIDLNATQAAIRAGYSDKTANEQGSRLLANVKVKEYIDELQKNVSERTQLDADWVVKRFKEISDRCMQAVPVMEYDPDSGQMIPSGEFKFDSSGANKATEMIGKHLGIFEKDNSQKKPDIKQVFKVGGKEIEF